MEADGGKGVMDDLLSQRTALQCADPASQHPHRVTDYREAPMGLFLAQRTAKNSKGPCGLTDYSSDGQGRRRPVEANRPGGPRSFQDSLGFAGCSPFHSHSSIQSIHPSASFLSPELFKSLVTSTYAFGRRLSSSVRPAAALAGCARGSRSVPGKKFYSFCLCLLL
ncbi:hypothetical protein ASPBRDRAFT_507884 [Aspergillus brasiliensis CBS 101740]|uniref:Uncharacterized protein n=1 Tax=Aspergillus brasiliensis (strain CBS 101740 / IMI 381727 / IBT 21946) TaxID=767769 RepID=A0A1L9UPJ3_ASPBC|nr:hypothetical protein ASPBRDRAFT_507884 [Aspergillus brasiliensis CBS 101740]